LDGVTDRSLPPKAPELHRLLEPLVRHGVDFVLIGGMAGIAHGSNYPSYDLDVVYARTRANVARLVTALAEIGVRLRGAPANLPFVLDAKTIENGANFTFVTPFGDLDVLGDVTGMRSFDDLATAAKERDVGGLPVRVASLGHLIAMKKAANRPKDRLMVEEYLVIADEQRLADEREKG
jgi:predicted nucleotidyltransferase